MALPLYMRSIVDRNIVMCHMTVCQVVKSDIYQVMKLP